MLCMTSVLDRMSYTNPNFPTFLSGQIFNFPKNIKINYIKMSKA